MTRRHIRRLHSLLFPAPVPDPEPYTRLDWLDGLPGRTRYDLEWPDVIAAEARVVHVNCPCSILPVGGDLSRHTGGFVDSDGNPMPEWLGGDLAAMAAPLPGMARDDLGDYAEPVGAELTAELVDAIRVGDPTPPEHGLDMCIAGERFLCTLPEGHPGRQHVAGGMVFVAAVWPRGRHRQTDPFDLILADLRDLEGQ